MLQLTCEMAVSYANSTKANLIESKVGFCHSLRLRMNMWVSDNLRIIV